MLRPIVRSMASHPHLFDTLRWILEGGFRGHRKLLQQHLQPVPGCVLDIGCGTGTYAACFPESRYTGIDQSPAYITAAAAKYPCHKFSVMDARQLQFPEQHVDAAFISGVLHHLSDADSLAVLKEMRRVVKRGGTMIIWEDIPAAWWNPVGQAIHALDLGQYIRTPDQYRQMIESVMPVDCWWTFRSGCMDYAAFRCISCG